MSDFYQMLSSVYKDVFPLAPAKINFLEKHLTAESNVLDLACGIGTDCEALAPKCKGLLGVDLDGAMIAQAPMLKGVSFLEMDMIDALKRDEKFDLIYCVGNSLVHLPSMVRVRECFDLVSKKLSPGGKFIFQIINFDRILDQRITNLPTITFTRGSFQREYDIIHDKVCFGGSLTVDGVSSVSSVMLLAPRKKEIETTLSSFSSVEFFGNFKGEAFDENSFHLIGVATI